MQQQPTPIRKEETPAEKAKREKRAEQRARYRENRASLRAWQALPMPEKRKIMKAKGMKI